MSIIEIDNVSMRFNLSKERHESFKEYFLALAKGHLQFDEFYALKNVNLRVEPGDFYGLIGLNGSGKSTLLKVISGVYKPTTGTVKVNGTIAPLIELGAGFDMDLTARENIYLNGTVLGFTPKYIDSKFDEIVEFSELRDFLDVPLKNYSSGMVARIAFAIATNTRLLLMDEPTNGLDIPAKACFRRVVARQMREDRTIVISTHQVRDVDALLDHVAVVDHSKILLNASTADITSRLVFEQRAAGEDTSDALYAQPNMMGNAIIARNTDGRDSQINLEMLFNALMENNALMEGNEETSLKP